MAEQHPTNLPPPEGPEYTPCTCGHIEPEHAPNASTCLVCACTAYSVTTSGSGYYERLDIPEALEAGGWIADDENPLDILRKNGATFAITNQCGDSAVSHADGWNIDFPSDVPVVVVIAACLAAAGESFVPLATVTRLRPKATA